MSSSIELRLSEIYANDREVFDLLEARAASINDKKLRSLLLARGIVPPATWDRAKLSRYFSRLRFSYADIVELAGQGKRVARRPKIRTQKIPISAEAKTSDVRATVRGELDKILDERRGTFNEASRVTQTPEGFRVKVRYTEFDQSACRLLQKTSRETNIEIALQDECVDVRFPVGSNLERSKDLAETISRAFAENLADQSLTGTPQEISSIGLTSAKSKTRFFLELIRGMDGFTVIDVLRVKLQKEPDDAEDPQDIEDAFLSDDDEDRDGDGDLDEDEYTEGFEATQEVRAAITNAVLDGGNVVNTDLFHQMHSTGYFVRAIQWEAERTDPLLRAKIETGFSSSGGDSEFWVRVHQVWHERKTRGGLPTGELLRTAKRPTLSEERLIVNAVLMAAETAQRAVQESKDEQ